MTSMKWSLLALFFVGVTRNTLGNTSSQLSKELFQNRGYESSVRPTCQINKINVTIDVALRQVIDLDEPTQILNILLWVRLKWNDCLLAWNSSDFGGLDNILVSGETVWTPDLALYDSVSGGLLDMSESRAAVYSDGTVYLNFPANIESRCVVDVTYFPWDHQTCSLPFGSWMQNGHNLDVFYKYRSGDITSYETNTEWDLVGFPAERNIKHYSCCPEPYPDVTYSIQLKRKPMFYVMNILVPCIAITGLTILVFLLPADSGEKMGMGVAILLTMSVFQLLVASSLPASAETVPHLTVYFSFVIILICYSMVVEVFVLCLWHTEGKKIPDWASYLFLKKRKNQNNRRKEPVQLKTIKTSTDSGDLYKHCHALKLDVEDEAPEKAWRALSILLDRLGLAVFLILWATGTVWLFKEFLNNGIQSSPDI